MKYKVKIVVFLIVVAAGATLWWFLGRVGRDSTLSEADTTAAPAAPQIFPETISETEQKALELPREFNHPLYKFSFNYPADFTAASLPSAEGGETIVVQNTKRNAGFQIHFEPHDDPDTDITAERLARDIPEMIVKEQQDILIGPLSSAGATVRQGKGIAFIASDTGTREVWFIFGGTLYQLTAPLENDTLLQRVLNTWQFE